MENNEQRKYIVFHKDLDFANNDLHINLGDRYIISREYDGVYFIEDNAGRTIGIHSDAIDKDVTLEIEE